ncbi:Leucine Rich Repeat [Seminavis robusta]|uniref:Leucine Rich Repeat n=1 Tax=Seminavis robusta TaxID=568900 RepID=A0A9N8H6P6_9STRA|nr:Leucine Rich Repeat [Seminavis robusta]|eukprot:Sro118_g057700.1 Leucine Rich Repeat (277) ;mRNA; r:42884-44095
MPQEESPPPCNEKGEIKALVFRIANNMDGTIPPEISFLGKSLQLLMLSRQHQLRGSIPTELGELTQLTELELGATGISGTLPRELGLLTKLGQIRLIQNNLLGSLPSELGKLGNITRFMLHGTHLTEKLDVIACPKLNMDFVLSEIAENFQQLQWLVLVQRARGDKMPIPSHLGKLPKLAALTLNDWNISDTVPSNFGDLALLITDSFTSLLTTIRLRLITCRRDLALLNRLNPENNSISGTFPQMLFKLTNMAYLFLGSNNLEGKLPLGFFTQLT